MLKVLSISAALIFLFVSSAMAQTGSRGACAADIKKTCANVQPGGGRIATCVKENLTNLSVACKRRFAEVAAAVNACRADAEKQCSTITRYIQKVACIKDALNNLGDDCKAATASVVTAKQ
jgi:hypothetical protein